MKMDQCYPRGVDSAKVIQVIETKSARGAGTPAQPARIVTEYWSLSGKSLPSLIQSERRLSTMTDDWLIAVGMLIAALLFWG